MLFNNIDNFKHFTISVKDGWAFADLGDGETQRLTKAHADAVFNRVELEDPIFKLCTVYHLAEHPDSKWKMAYRVGDSKVILSNSPKIHLRINEQICNDKISVQIIYADDRRVCLITIHDIGKYAVFEDWPEDVYEFKKGTAYFVRHCNYFEDCDDQWVRKYRACFIIRHLSSWYQCDCATRSLYHYTTEYDVQEDADGLKLVIPVAQWPYKPKEEFRMVLIA